MASRLAIGRGAGVGGFHGAWLGAWIARDPPKTSAIHRHDVRTTYLSWRVAFYTNSVVTTHHCNFYDLYGIAAAVLGGCSLRGGEGSIIGIVLGTTLLVLLQNLVILLNIPSSLNFAVMGAVVLFGVLAEQLF